MPSLVDQSIAEVLPLKVGHAGYLAHQSEIFLFADEPWNLPIGGHTPLQDLTDRSQHLVDEIIVQNLPITGLSPWLGWLKQSCLLPPVSAESASYLRLRRNQ